MRALLDTNDCTSLVVRPINFTDATIFEDSAVNARDA